MATRSKIEIANSLRQLANELDGAAGIVDAQSYPPVFDVQPLGYTKIGAVEEFRDELNASLDPLAKRYVATLPHWWFVQDAEEYVDLTEELVALISAQRNFQANAKAIETDSAMTTAIINIRS